MRTREEVLQYALSFPNVYEERPFRDQGWQLVRVKESKKTFLFLRKRPGCGLPLQSQMDGFWPWPYRLGEK